MALAEAWLTPRGENGHTVVVFQPLRLDEIPGAMDKMGWGVAAALMRRWFGNPLYVMTKEEKRRLSASDARILSPQYFDDQIVKMQWALQYPAIQIALNDLLANAQSAEAKIILKTRLENSGWRAGNKMILGEYGANARALDATCQIQRELFGNETDVIDGLYGALGKAVLKLAVTGVMNKSEFVVEHIGIYIRDTYDFTNRVWHGVKTPELLGIWSRERCLSKWEMVGYLNGMNQGWRPSDEHFMGFVPMFNDDFRRWQKKHGTGGDYIVYSDVKWMVPPAHLRTISL